MEYEKDLGDRFSFGFGTAKTAGLGDLRDAQKVPKSLKYKHDRQEILTSAAKAAVLTGIIILNHKRKKKK